MRRLAARVLLLGLAVGSLAACGETVVADFPVVPPGPVPALAGTWTFEMDKATITCGGQMTIDGATGVGTYSGCGATGAPLASQVDANQHFLIVFQPPGIEPYWTRGMFVSAAELDGAMYGHGWNGQQGFRATRN